MKQASTPSTRGYEQLPIPFGWFAVASSDEIASGQLKTLRYFGQELVAWRTDGGVLSVVDPYCPHLGAHLGGGEVIGDELRCPFHHWSYNATGGVTDIPYAKLVPPKLKRACLPTWPAEERNGLIFVWHHPRRVAPKWDVASASLIDEENWVLGQKEEWIIKIHIQEITENGQDYAHFRAVHGTQGPPASEFKLDGWTRRNTVVTEMVTPRGPMTGKIDSMAVGPGQSFIRYTDVTEVYQLQQLTPIDAETTHMRWQLYHPPGISEGKMRVTAARMRDLVKQVTQDIPIWERKRYMAHPQLVDGDGPILAYRKQYERFYQFDDAEPTVAAA